MLALIFTAVDVGPDAAVVNEEDRSPPEEWPLEVDAVPMAESERNGISKVN